MCLKNQCFSSTSHAQGVSDDGLVVGHAGELSLITLYFSSKVVTACIQILQFVFGSFRRTVRSTLSRISKLDSYGKWGRSIITLLVLAMRSLPM